MGNSPPIRGMGGWAKATAIAARKRRRRCSTYARPVSGAVVCHKSSEEDFLCMVTMVALLFMYAVDALALFLPPRGKRLLLLL